MRDKNKHFLLSVYFSTARMLNRSLLNLCTEHKKWKIFLAVFQDFFRNANSATMLVLSVRPKWRTLQNTK